MPKLPPELLPGYVAPALVFPAQEPGNVKAYGDLLTNAALRYAAAGIYTYPVRIGYADPGTWVKKDLHFDASWKNHSSVFPHVIKSEKWRKVFYGPGGGLIIDCGRSNLDAIDVDSDAATEFYASLGMPETATATTPRPGVAGRHYYFRSHADLELKNSQSALAGGLDVRTAAGNGLIIAPPTYHPSGTREWVGGWPQWAEIPTIPRELAERWVEEAAKKAPATRPRQGHYYTPAEALKYVEVQALEPLRTATNGSINGKANAAACVLSRFQPVFWNPSQLIKMFDDALAQTEYDGATWKAERFYPIIRGEEPIKDPWTAERTLTPEEFDGNGCNDASNGRRLVRKFGNDLKHTEPTGYLLWTGTRWAAGRQAEIIQMAKRTASAIYAEAEQAASEGKDGRALAAHATKSLNRSGILGMMWSAQSEPEIRLNLSELDADPWLLSCGNGVINLQTGELLEAKREQLITKGTDLDYQPGPTPQWSKFMKWFTRGDTDLERYLQMAAGMSLTANRVEEIFVMYGATGGNGKGTFIHALERAAGEYAQPVQPSTLEQKRGNNGHTDDVAKLFGARLGTVAESKAGQTWDLSLVKQIAGGDRLTASEKGKSNFSFHPYVKFWVHTNHKPRIGGDDEAIKRRLKLIPCQAEIEGPIDGELKYRMVREEGAAILAWFVEGAVAWAKAGRRLSEPDVVRKTSARYFQEEDKFATAIEQLVFEPGAKLLNDQLKQVFMAWQADSGDAATQYAEFSRAVTHRGEVNGVDVESYKNSGKRGLRGVRLRTAQDSRVGNYSQPSLRTVTK